MDVNEGGQLTGQNTQRRKFDYLQSFERQALETWEGSLRHHPCFKWFKRNAWIPISIFLGGLVLCAAVPGIQFLINTNDVSPPPPPGLNASGTTTTT